jgi:hypothetical protein
MLLDSASELRHALALALDGVRNDDHELLVEQLRAQHAHTITIIGKHDPLRPEADDREYTCFAFALGLGGVARHAGAEFVTWLMHRRLLRELHEDKVKDGDVAIYREAGHLRHAGRVKGRRIISKWGVGLLYDHQPHEVPSVYGEECAFFRRLTPRLAADSYRAWLTAQPA